MLGRPGAVGNVFAVEPLAGQGAKGAFVHTVLAGPAGLGPDLVSRAGWEAMNRANRSGGERATVVGDDHDRAELAGGLVGDRLQQGGPARVWASVIASSIAVMASC